MDEIFLQYGILGVLAFGLWKVVVRLYKRLEDHSSEQDERLKKNEEKIEKMQDRLDLYVSQDRQEMLQVIRDNTEALKSIKTHS